MYKKALGILQVALISVIKLASQIQWFLILYSKDVFEHNAVSEEGGHLIVFEPRISKHLDTSALVLRALGIDGQSYSLFISGNRYIL